MLKKLQVYPADCDTSRQTPLGSLLEGSRTQPFCQQDHRVPSDRWQSFAAHRPLQAAAATWSGMGEIWMAEQEKPVRRRVTLKLIKEGMDSRAVLARFDAERQALAMMNHPNIAKVFEAGSVGPEDQSMGIGRPYFVMELVQGIPIT
ncbi:MAG: hypothetical protein ABL921_18390 [Pirellula sp.]